MAGGQAIWGPCFALTLVLAGGCGLGGEPLSAPDPPTTEPEDPPDATSTTEDNRVAQRHYDVGDCVYWDESAPDDSLGLKPTEVVPCTETHYIQISGEEIAPDWETYPTAEEWDTYIQDVCKSRATALLGGPLDPYGRFGAGALRPSPDSWARADRSVWCGVAMAGVLDRSHWTPMTEDVRGADQWYHWDVGQCLAYPPAVQARVAVVPCTEPHQREITGRVDYTDQSQVPVGGGDARCNALAGAYLAGQPPGPWSSGTEVLAPESWAAGLRFSHCFMGQWNPDGTGPNVISVPVRG